MPATATAGGMMNAMRGMRPRWSIVVVMSLILATAFLLSRFMSGSSPSLGEEVGHVKEWKTHEEGDGDVNGDTQVSGVEMCGRVAKRKHFIEDNRLVRGRVIFGDRYEEGLSKPAKTNETRPYASTKVIRFILLTKQRSGSKWVLDQIHSLPTLVHMHGEAFGWMSGYSLYRWVAQRIDTYRKVDASVLERSFRLDAGGTRVWDDDLVDYERGVYEFMTYLYDDQGPKLDYTGDDEGGPQFFQVRGWKLMLNHLKHLSPAAFRGLERFLDDNCDVKIIHLDRHNLVDIVLSKARSKKTGSSHCKTACDHAFTTTLDPEWLMKRLDALEEQGRQAIESTAGLRAKHHWLDITYETLVGNPKEEWCRVLDFLEISSGDRTRAAERMHAAENLRAAERFTLPDYITRLSRYNVTYISSHSDFTLGYASCDETYAFLNSKQQKMTTNSHRQVIENFDVIADAFRDTKYAQYLRDELL
eukprot:TRINITY_DN7834_c0_g1_i1.p1 TRINITY_DN7834_c0_g1~~TRINITY_DN7834_c0_g1_i1.p1  ORF type:complete len:473 (-),score=87.74 TRINITY_DN7834_c0_g1_i1:45-1463(-)